MGIVYRHTQRSRVTTVLLGMVWITAVVLAVSIAQPIPMVMAGLLTLLVFSFSSLTVSIQDGALEVLFGPGWIHRRIPLQRVRDVEVVQSPWYYGWGIRLTPRGWLWNLWGFGGVELTFDDGHHFRIGSDQPEALAEAIRAAL
jgi:hypothetical protein